MLTLVQFKGKMKLINMILLLSLLLLTIPAFCAGDETCHAILETENSYGAVVFNNCLSANSVIFDWDDVASATQYEVLYNDGSGHSVTVTASTVQIDQQITALCYGQKY